MKATLFTLLTAAFALASTSVASAQIGIGLRAGVLSSGSVINEIEDDNETELDTDNVTGFIISVPVEIALSNIFSVQPEVNYLRRGYKFPEDLDNGVQENQTTYNVLEIPVLAKLGYTTENFTAALTFGPAFQYLLSGQFESQDLDTPVGSVEGVKVDLDFDDPIFEDIERANFYGQAGLQFGIPAGGGKIIIDGRYRFSINDQDGSDEQEIRDRGLSATLGYMVTLGDY